ncbi:hypothetical protein D7Y13_24580 [Corallococcus praedator]|uniref:Uncharacterized protein n=1 Tax=Corallococcus praedator TaxID=2316724 RepID=A0ABX9QF58_9BACT|nr:MULTISPECIES: hypothetical protein [Corallococcus]RKH15844.1 hypothetical protein D7X74_17355 [Corallococcus sp. CA047B]RKH28565.1 hypothetical protein D7X75_24530 [Corallococcus sp. CA031C]RKI02450.1 hypothetical protein D7Y13_24580 [Corallococcus praedator]
MRDVLRALGVLCATALLRVATPLLKLLERHQPRPTSTSTTGRPALRVLPGGLSTKHEVQRHG